MKLNFWKQFLSAIVLTVAVCGVVNAQAVPVEIDFTTGAGDTGDLLDGNSSGTFAVPEATAAGTSLNITIGGVSAGGFIDAAGSTTGVNTSEAGTDTTFFNVNESATFFFDQDVELLLGDFNNLSGTEFLSITTSNGGNFTINDGNTNVVDNDFDFGTFSLPAGQTFTIAGGSGAAGIENLSINVVPAAVPEPSSAALLGLLGLGVIARRRR